MTNKTLKKIIIVVSILLLVFTTMLSYQELVYNCDTKRVNFGLGDSKIETASLKDTNISIDFSVTESEYDKLQERNFSYKRGNTFEDLIKNYTRSNCLSSNPDFELIINSNNNQIRTSPLFIDKYQPLRIDFFR